MPPIHINMDALRENPPAEVRMNAEDNSMDATLEYEVAESKWLEVLQTLQTEHPVFPGLMLREIIARRIPGDVRKIILSYKASLAETTMEQGGGPRTSYEMGRSLVEEPLLTHPRYDDVPDEERRALHAMIQGHTKDEKGTTLEAIIHSALGQEAMAKIKKGRVTFLSPVRVWRRKTNGMTLPTGAVGQIAVPPGPVPLTDGKNWLYMGDTSRLTPTEKAWDSDEEWQESGVEGWDAELYTAPAE
jgi:hypothetical protein